MILVMAASGRLGGRVIEHLLTDGCAADDIVAGARSPDKLSRFTERGVQVRRADYTDPESLETAYQGVDTVVVIPSTSPVAPRIQEHANALTAARSAGVKRVIFLSINSCTPESRSLIAPFILYAESATRLSGMEWLLLRMNIYIDPLADWAPELAKTGRLPYPVKQGRVAYVSRDDIARAIAAAAQDMNLKGEILELSGAEAITMDELAEALTTATGSNIRFDSASDEEFVDICRQDGTPEFITQVLLSLYHAVDSGEFARVTDHIERLTGSPPESVPDYLIRTLRNRTAED